MSKLNKKGTELTQKEWEALVLDLEEFDELLFLKLAERDRFEIVPTVGKDGARLTRKQSALIKKEAERLGLAILYQIDHSEGKSLLVNSKTLKSALISEEVH
jgi:hypothetical protein